MSAIRVFLLEDELATRGSMLRRIVSVPGRNVPGIANALAAARLKPAVEPRSEDFFEARHPAHAVTGKH